MSSVCDPVTVATQGKYTPGDKYSCKVDPNKPRYTFYVLNTEGTSVNLIMDSNIRSDGTPVKDTSDLALVTYNSSVDASGTGPTTAIEYLNNATSSWKNILNLNETYNDEGENFTNFALTGKARMPKLSEVVETGCDITKREDGTCPLWMVDHLENDEYFNYNGRTAVSNVLGYWTLSSIASHSGYAWHVSYAGYASTTTINLVDRLGVRPVINLSI